MIGPRLGGHPIRDFAVIEGAHGVIVDGPTIGGVGARLQTRCDVSSGVVGVARQENAALVGVDVPAAAYRTYVELAPVFIELPQWTGLDWKVGWGDTQLGWALRLLTHLRG